MNIPNDGGWGKPAAGRDAGGLELEGGQGRAAEAPGKGFMGPISAISGDWVLLGCLALTASLFLGIGLLSARQSQPPKDPLWIEQLPASELPGSVGTSTQVEQGTGATEPQAPVAHSQRYAAPVAQPAAAASATLPKAGKYVASKTGTKYYLPTCATVKRIKDANKVWFATKQAAEAAGYQPAANCKGL